MSKELEHIDALFRDKLKTYREPPSNKAWDKLSAMLDDPSNTNNGNSAKNIGRWGLLSLFTLSFVFVFPGHDFEQIKAEQKIEATQITAKEPALRPQQLNEEMAHAKPGRKKESFENASNSLQKPKQQTVVMPQNVEAVKEKLALDQKVIKEESTVTQKFISNKISIEKKPALPLFIKKEKKQKPKGIKVEITLGGPNQKNRVRQAAPQTKNTINSIFKKLRKISEASKRN